MNFLFNVVVWGDLYTDFFLDVALKAQLAPGNLPQFVGENQGHCKYLIYTTADSAQKIRESGAFQSLRHLVATDFVLIESIDSYSRDIRKTPVLCNAHAMRLAVENDYRLIFLVPDMIFSDGSFANLLKIANTGKRVIMLGYFRTLWESFVPAFKQLYATDQPFISVSSRSLIKLALNHLHPETESWTWGSPNFRGKDPVFLYAAVPGKGLIERSFHLHPILISPDTSSALPEIESDWSIDGSSYLSQAFPNSDDYYYVQDSDEVFVIDLLPYDDRYKDYVKPGKFNYIDLLLWPTRHAYASHINNYKHKIYFHIDDVDSSWQEADKISDYVAASLDAMLDLSIKYPDVYNNISQICDERNQAINELNSLQQVACNELMKKNERIVILLNELGTQYLRQGNADLAINTFTDAVNLLPEDPVAHLNLARSYALNKMYTQAFGQISQVLQLQPNNNEALGIAESLINNTKDVHPSLAIPRPQDTTRSLKYLIIVPRFIAAYGQYYTFPLGLAYISAVLKHDGHHVDVINLNHQLGSIDEVISSAITRNMIDVVCTGGLSVHYLKIRDVIAAAQRAKEGIITIVGGGLLSSEPELVMNALGATYGVIGEGEQTIVELARALRTSQPNVANIHGLAYRNAAKELMRTPEREPIENLDSLPYPDYDGLELRKYLETIVPNDERELAIVDNPRPISLISSRSCPFSCTFCYHPLGKKYRQRSLDSFFTELHYWVTNYDINIVFILDELFSLQRERIVEFCSRIKAYNIKWVVQLTVKNISKELLDLMKDAGCYLISYGIESGSDTILKSMKKPVSVTDIIDALELTYDSNIGVQGNFIFGDVAETAKTVVETLSCWLRLQKKHYLYMVPIEVYPGTELYHTAVTRGILSDKLQYLEDCCPSLNLTSMDNALYLRISLLIYILRKSYQAIPANLLSIAPDTMHPIKGNLIRAIVVCPHCNATIEYRNLMATTHFMTSCRACNRRFDVPLSVNKSEYPLNFTMAKAYSFSESHISELNKFVDPNNFDWLISDNINVNGFSSKFIAINLLGIKYLLPASFSLDDIRSHKLPLYVFNNERIEPLLSI